jgi:hypothetical protein
MSESDPLSQLSASIADGDAIDWEVVRALAGDEEIRQLIDHLRVVAGVAEVHRSQIAETIAAEIAPVANPAIGARQHDGPARWGHLVLIRKIGEGSFGEVYEALDTWLDHPRALKLLKPEIANRASAPQILHEARKLVRVRHPNVVMVHGADSHDGRVGFWMDLIEGQTLEQRVRESRLSAGEATYVGQELCRALAAVHHANLVHRDIKAQNVMRATDGGRIILMDFGAGEFRDVPSSGRPHGTPLYLAPEVITGGAATVQTDVYALGVLLYYLVTGRFPVEGNSLTDLVLAHAQGARRHLRDARPDLPDSYITVVERATARDPNQRFQSAGDFYAALEDRGTVTGPAVVVTPAPTPTPPPYPQLPLGQVLLAALTTVLAIAVCGLVACRSFEAVLNIGKEYSGGPTDYFTIGVQALIPFALHWLAAIAIVTLLAGVRLALGSRGGRLFERWRSLVHGVRPTVLATIIPAAGAVVWLAFSFYYWPIVDTLAAVQLGPPPGSHLPLLDKAFRGRLLAYSEMAALLSFCLIFAIWRWWPEFERRSDDVSAVRRAKWACIALAAVVVVTAVAPRRFAMEYFEAMLYKNEPAFVIGTSGDELLLYLPKATDNVRPTVRRGDSDLVPAQKPLWLVSADDIPSSKHSP